jgi:hypothetical protein
VTYFKQVSDGRKLYFGALCVYIAQAWKWHSQGSDDFGLLLPSKTLMKLYLNLIS